MKAELPGRVNGAGRRVLRETLREWLDVFARMIATVPSAIYFKDTSGRLRTFNRAFENFMNMPGERLAGRRVHDVLPKQTADFLEKMDGDLLRGNSLYQNFQTSYVDVFGRELSVLVNKSILNLHGFHQGIIGVITDVTELHKTRGELDNSRKLLANVFEAIPDLLSVHDRNLRIVHSNWHGGYGHVPEELRTGGNYCYDMYYPGQGKPCTPCHVLEVFRTGKPVISEKHNPRVGHMEAHAFPIFDEAGSVMMVAEHVRNITERKQAETEIKASESNYRAIFDGTNDAIFVLDPESGSIVDVNRKMCEMYGCTRNQALRLDVEAFSSGRVPYTQSFALDYIRKAAVGESQLFEWLAKTMDGRLFWVEVNIKKILLGGAVRALASVRDISERKLAEEAHRESEERFRRIFEQHEDAAMIVCPETLVIIDVNPTLVMHYGFSPKRLFSEGPGIFLRKTELDRIREALGGITETGQIRIEPLVTFNRRDERILTSFKAKLIKARGVSYAYCTFRDITERLRIREETKRMQAKLLQTNKMAALGTLSSGIAHEINNPSNFILSNARMLHDAWKDIGLILEEYAREQGDFSIGGFDFSEARDTVPKLIEGIIEGSHRIRDILAGLREYARDEKTQPLQKVDVNTVVTKSFTMLQNHIRSHTEHFHCSLAPDAPLVRGSFQQLEQVVVNLAMNALQALPTRNCGVYISVFRDRPTGNVVIKVRDQGVGMPPEVVKRIFDPFFTTRLDSGGTGLGLSICYSIIKDHQGTIEVESEPGTGTSVYVRIPPCSRGEKAHEERLAE